MVFLKIVPHFAKQIFDSINHKKLKNNFVRLVSKKKLIKLFKKKKFL